MLPIIQTYRQLSTSLLKRVVVLPPAARPVKYLRSTCMPQIVVVRLRYNCLSAAFEAGSTHA
jgi:hypothetical protein